MRETEGIMDERGAGRLCLPHNVVARSFASETVLLDVNEGRYFRLDRAAGALLDALLAHGSVGGAAAALAVEGWADAGVLSAELDALSAELLELGLLRHAERLAPAWVTA
jgi:Coenzyme PQQ synthesis protein D (PqqD)